MTDEPVTYRSRARQALETARLLHDYGDQIAAANRAYYAIFDAMRAALTELSDVDPRLIKTHNGTLRVFELNFVKTGRLDRSVSRSIRKVEDLRLTADYIELQIPAPVIAEILGFAAHAVAEIETLLDRPPDEGPTP